MVNRNVISFALIVCALSVARPIFGGDDKSDQQAVSAFKQYIADYMKSYQTDKRERLDQLSGGWVKEYFEVVGDPSIDARKTDSLISPYTGICEFTLVRHFTGFHSSADEARADNAFTKSDKTKHKHTYSFQDGQWVPT